VVNDQVDGKRGLRRRAVEVKDAEVLVGSNEERDYGSPVDHSGWRSNRYPGRATITRLLESNRLCAGGLIGLDRNVDPEAAIVRGCSWPEGYG